jgi:ABC-type dipeptide/oligopeptide/nickel transport system permease subunit
MVALVTFGDWNHGAGGDLLARDAAGRLWFSTRVTTMEACAPQSRSAAVGTSWTYLG